MSGALLLAALVCFAPGCTLLDEVFSGTPFTPDQPEGEVTVVGKIYIDRVSRSTEGCSAGKTMLWGMARNTGDIDVVDVFIEIDALDSNNNVIGTYRVNVFNGDVVETEQTPDPDADPDTTLEPVQTAGTSLDVDQSGTFEACTGLSFGTVAGTAYRTDFIVVEAIE